MLVLEVLRNLELSILFKLEKIQNILVKYDIIKTLNGMKSMKLIMKHKLEI